METPKGTVLNGGEWNALLNTTHGEEIVEMLQPFLDRSPRLSPARPDLEQQVKAALRPISEVVRRVTVLPASNVETAAKLLDAALPPSLNQRVQDALREGLREQPRIDLWAELKICSLATVTVGITDQTWALLETTLWLTFSGSPWYGFEECLPHPSWTHLRVRLRRSLEGVLCQRIAYLARQDDLDDSRDVDRLVGERIEPLIELFLAGNFPVGRLEDRGFLILVE